MNGKTLEKRIYRDLDRTKRDLAILRDDTVTGLNHRLQQITEGPKKSAAVAVKSLNKSIGQGLDQYNSKIQEFVSKVPGNLPKKAARYPWVAISMAIVVGLFLGSMMKPNRPRQLTNRYQEARFDPQHAVEPEERL